MNELLEVILNDSEIECGGSLEMRRLMLYNHNLKEAGLAELPEDLMRFLHQANGIWFDGASIFGAEPASGLFTDIMSANLDLNRKDRDKVLVLGEDENDFLIYNEVIESYQIIDKIDGMVGAKYATIKEAVEHILKI